MPRTIEISRPLGRIGRHFIVALALTTALVSAGSSLAEVGRRPQILFVIALSALIGVLLVERRTRRRAQAELSDAEQRYRAVADFTADLEYWIRPDGSFAYVSPSCRQLTGHEPSEFLQRPELMTGLVVEEDRQEWESHHRLASTSAELLPECRLRSRSGKLIWVAVVVSPVATADGRDLGVRGSVRDITARKRAEKELRETLEENKRLRSQLAIDNTYRREDLAPAGPTPVRDRHIVDHRHIVSRSMEDLQREHIRSTLEDRYWRVEGPGGAAEALGMNASTLRSRMRKLGIQRPGRGPSSILRVS